MEKMNKQIETLQILTVQHFMQHLEPLISSSIEMEKRLEKVEARITPGLDQLATTDDICAAFSVTENTVRMWRVKMEMPYVKIGSTIRYFAPAVREWLQGFKLKHSTSLHAGLSELSVVV